MEIILEEGNRGEERRKGEAARGEEKKSITPTTRQAKVEDRDSLELG